MMVEKLVAYLKECDNAYYNSDQVIVNNDTYDALVETLRRLDPNHSYLKKVGAETPKSSQRKLGHMVPMGTLSKYHKEEEVSKWLDSEKGEILLSPKYDGFAVELVYDKGNLAYASTRGDGYVGEDVLSAVMRIESVPISLSDDSSVIVRGEAIIPLIHHDRVKELGYTAMRNAVPGIVRSGRVDALRYVDFVAYEFIDGSKDRVSQREKYRKNFIVEDFHHLNYQDISTMDSIRKELRESYYYELDGVVLKTRFILEDDLLNPSHMISWKYKSNRESTVLRDIEFQMGVSGYFTPIGIFDEVEFQGAKLKRASLGNITRMKKEFPNVTVGSIIEVSRRGDIIPYIEELVLANEEGELLGLGNTCPHCGTLLSYDNDEPYCPSKSCPEKLRLQISQFARSIGVKGIGDKLVRGLIDSGFLKNIVDVYEMNPESILEIPRQGNSSVEKWRALQSKELSTLEIFSCYPLLDLGEKIWKLVFSRYTPEEVLSITYDELYSANIRGLGDKKIRSIVNQVSANKEELLYLLNKHKR